MTGPVSKTAQAIGRLHLSPAFLAAVAFVIIQVSIGIIFKIAQRDDGKYAFSQSSSIVISEFCKFLLSASFFHHQCRQRLRKSSSDDLEKAPTVVASGGNQHQDRESEDMQEKTSLGSARDSRYVDISDSEDSRRSTSLSSTASARGTKVLRTNGQQAGDAGKQSIPLHRFVKLVTHEISPQSVYGMAHLALLYAVINNSVFLLYRLADPGTISLVRSGITLITALTLMCTSGTVITSRQWVAILFQICGVVVTQYTPGKGGLYPAWTYLLLIFQTTVSACAGVYNQSLLKSESGSLHVCNMALYAAGTLVNMMVHLTARAMDPTEPSFFQGYNSWGAVMVITSNVFIGLAITAVYKYSDALVKCFATAVSTGVLLYIAPIIFQVPLSFLVIPGTITVFAATWLYLVSAPPKSAAAPAEWKDAVIDGRHLTRAAKFRALFNRFSPYGSLPQIGLAFTSSATVILIMALASSRVNAPGSGDGAIVPVVESPLKDTLAFVRWNRAVPERIETLMKYRPFFKEMHISMPGYLHNKEECTGAFDSECGLSLFNNLTADNYDDPMLIYTSVAATMQGILDAPSNSTEGEIKGLTYFHFDAWLDPMGFNGEDLNKIWFPDASDPPFECMTTEAGFPGWWGWTEEFNTSSKALAALEEVVKHLDSSARSRINPKEYCTGWSDIYHIPRSYFRDYIYLSRVFYAHGVVHEVAIPTIIHIIDLTRRAHELHSHSVVTHLSDCWGSCCSQDPHPTDLVWHRCGHKLDLKNATLAKVFYDKLDMSAETLGTPLYDESAARPLSDVETIFDPAEVNSIMSKATSMEALYALAHVDTDEDQE